MSLVERNSVDRKEDGELANALSLAENCESQLYRQTTDLMDLSLNLMGLELAESLKNYDHLQLKNRLKRMDVGQYKAPRWVEHRAEWLARLWSKRVFRWLLMVVALYLVIKYLALTHLQSEYDELLKQWQPERSQVRLSTGDCALPSGDHNSSERQQLIAKLGNTRARLDQLGSLFSDIYGPFIYGILVAYPVVLGPISWWTAGRYEIRLDWLAFMFEPLKESQRIDGELQKLLADLFGSIQYWPHPVELTQQVCSELGHLAGTFGAAHLSQHWHRRLLLIVYRFYVLKWLLALFVAVTVSTVFVLMVLHTSLKVRLAQINCQRWHPEAFLVRPCKFSGHTGFKLVDNDGDLAAYLNYSPQSSSWLQFLHLLVLVEPKYALTKRSILMWLELFNIITVIAIWFGTCISLYLMALLNTIVWLRQINHQLDGCIRMVNNDNKQHFRKQLAKTYINYALFKSQFANLQRLARLFTGQGILLNAVNIWAIVVTKRSFSDSYHMNAFLAMSFVSFFIALNGYFSTYSYLFLQAERAMRRISLLLAKIEHNISAKQRQQSSSLNFWFTIWRRQLLDGYEMNKLFGLTMMTVRFSFTHLVQVNVYPTAVITYFV